MLLRDRDRSTEHDHTPLIAIAVGVSTYLLRVVLKMLCVILQKDRTQRKYVVLKPNNSEERSLMLAMD